MMFGDSPFLPIKEPHVDEVLLCCDQDGISEVSDLLCLDWGEFEREFESN